MFNRQPFNRGNFNRSNQKTNRVLMGGNIALTFDASGKMGVAQALISSAIEISICSTGEIQRAAHLAGEIAISVEASGVKGRAKYFSGSIEIALNIDGNMTRGRTSAGNITIALALAGRGFSNFITDYVHIENIQFRPGDEIIIDMDSMTVTQNGINIMKFVHRDSEFFLFNPGSNDITYQTTDADSHVDMRILWRDARL